MQKRNEEIIIKGKPTIFEVYLIDNYEVIIKGKIIKIAQLKEEWDSDVKDPETLVKKLKASGIKADIFTFMQRLPDSRPVFDYPMEWDNVAALPITTYDLWFKNQLHQNSRNKIRISQKKGLVVKPCEFDDDLLRGIMSIYNETPIRQGRHYWNYGMDFDLTRKENCQFLDRADFIGAFYKDELIGYIRLVYTKVFARTMGILAKIAHRDKSTMNALIAKAVEICAEKKIPFLVYAKYDYGKLGSDSLADFKHFNGFESIILPRYYIPLTWWGTIIMKLNLHYGVVGPIPRKLVKLLRELRNAWYSRMAKKVTIPTDVD